MPMTTNDSQERGSHGSPAANADNRGFFLLSVTIRVAKHPLHPRSNGRKENSALAVII